MQAARLAGRSIKQNASDGIGSSTRIKQAAWMRLAAVRYVHNAKSMLN